MCLPMCINRKLYGSYGSLYSSPPFELVGHISKHHKGKIMKNQSTMSNGSLKDVLKKRRGKPGHMDPPKSHNKAK